MTREVRENGWGLLPAEAALVLEACWQACDLMPDPDDLTKEWLRLCGKHGVRGKQAHDARIVAFMTLQGIGELATMNPVDFSRYQEIEVFKM